MGVNPYNPIDEAELIVMEDTGGYYAVDNVEAALQEVGAFMVADDLWDRTGTTLHPHNVGDSVQVDDALDVYGVGTFHESFGINRVIKPTACTAALAGVGAGNVDNGIHSYQVAFYTADGHTEPGTTSNVVTVVDKASDGKVQLTNIPTSTDDRVVGRYIFRKKATDAYFYLLADIADNTTTTYLDNTADAGLGFRNSSYDNTTLRVLDESGDTLMMLGQTNFGFGVGALAGDLTKGNNTAFGLESLEDATDSYANTAFGFRAGANVTDGESNVFFGPITGNAISHGDRNTIIGDTSGPWTNDISRGVFIGYNAGWYETNDDRLHIGVDKNNTLIYGEFDNKKLEIRGNLTIGEGAAGVDYTLTFNGESNDGVVTWMEDEDYFRFEDDVVFNTGAGLCYGEIYASDASSTVTITGTGKGNKVQITAFDVDGHSNNMTPDHTNDHVTVDVAGKYMCNVSLHAISTGGGGADLYGYSVYKNNGATEFANLHGQRNLTGGGGDEGSMSLSGIIDLSVNDTVEVWIWNNTNTDDVIVDDITLSLVQIGG
jgi:hypothetical protein